MRKPWWWQLAAGKRWGPRSRGTPLWAALARAEEGAQGKRVEPQSHCLGSCCRRDVLFPMSVCFCLLRWLCDGFAALPSLGKERPRGFRSPLWPGRRWPRPRRPGRPAAVGGRRRQRSRHSGTPSSDAQRRSELGAAIGCGIFEDFAEEAQSSKSCEPMVNRTACVCRPSRNMSQIKTRSEASFPMRRRFSSRTCRPTLQSDGTETTLVLTCPCWGLDWTPGTLKKFRETVGLILSAS